MTNVSVVSYSTGGSGGEDRLTENVVLHFASMQGAYVTQNPDGSTVDGVESSRKAARADSGYFGNGPK